LGVEAFLSKHAHPRHPTQRAVQKCDRLYLPADGSGNVRFSNEVLTAVPDSLLAFLLDPEDEDVFLRNVGFSLKYKALQPTAMTTSNPKHNYSIVGAQHIEK
jgi:hypothetical protein